jgi:hypothetical protein
MPIQVDSSELQRQYSSAEGQWKTGRDYDPATTLTPLESRKAALASQREAYQLRGQNYRSQIEEFERNKISTLEARVAVRITSRGVKNKSLFIFLSVQGLKASIKEAEKTLSVQHDALQAHRKESIGWFH